MAKKQRDPVTVLLERAMGRNSLSYLALARVSGMKTETVKRLIRDRRGDLVKLRILMHLLGYDLSVRKRGWGKKAGKPKPEVIRANRRSRFKLGKMWAVLDTLDKV